MSILKGEVVVECDVRGCHACETLVEADLKAATLPQALAAKGWEKNGVGKDICPQCVEEGAAL